MVRPMVMNTAIWGREREGYVTGLGDERGIGGQFLLIDIAG